jgi:hypothetical protein
VLVDDTTGLRQASTFMKIRDELIFGLFVATVLLLSLAIFGSTGRRKGVLKASYTVIIVGALTLLIILIANMVLSSAAEERVVVREIVKAVQSNLQLQSLALLILGLCGVALADTRIAGGLQRTEERALAWAGHADLSLILIGAAGVALLIILL